MSRCSDPDCFAHEGDGCARGETVLTDCPLWTRAEPDAEADERSTLDEVPGGARVPWSGAALGIADMLLLTPRGRTALIGVVGAHDAGKTTLLTGAYLSMLKGNALAAAHFAGSRTLGAWESLAAWTRLDGSDRRPTFPPRTSRSTARGKGLLHLALRGGDGRVTDVLLTDAPGEWFTEWSRRAEGDEAAGARWIVERADALLLVADCVRLAGAGKGRTKRQLFEIIDRLGPAVGGRPVTLVWAKAEHSVSPAYRRGILRRLRARIPHAGTVQSQISQPGTLATAVGHAIAACQGPPSTAPLVAPIADASPFGAFRGHP